MAYLFDMVIESLKPKVEHIIQDYVLVQAWKKTSAHIRNHNWYSDTLELDRVTVNLPQFIRELSRKLNSYKEWESGPLRMVPAPKTQKWGVNKQSKEWRPTNKTGIQAPLRPLAHVSLIDQVAATAIMLCLSDRVETIQGDPRADVLKPKTRKRIVSYGNRLFCDEKAGKLHHIWGSGKLYRGYYQDYQTFLQRPEIAAKTVEASEGFQTVIVHSDLRQFYDRVSPELLSKKISKLKRKEDDPGFFELTNKILSWKWDKKDAQDVREYEVQSGLADFSKVALPQGLVGGGFFANITLLDFDYSVRKSIGKEIASGIRLEDFCRYVDDLRIVLSVNQKRFSNNIIQETEKVVTEWLKELLDSQAKGLEPSIEKTRAAAFRGSDRPLVQQSRKMVRIQEAISGGFDAIGGEEILDAVQGLIRSQQRYSEQRINDDGWALSPIPDVRDSTVERFAAARYRTTYRSLRPLLTDRDDTVSNKNQNADDESEEKEEGGRFSGTRTQADLDEEAKAFALGLIESWVGNPSNVRLLRIGLDLWPAEDVLGYVLQLLRPFTMKGGARKAPRRVAWYCLSEIFRAGATETGFVEDSESLPASVNVQNYRSALLKEALRLLNTRDTILPWYLRQQALLFLAASQSSNKLSDQAGRGSEIKQYLGLILFVNGDHREIATEEFATLSVLSRRSYRSKEKALEIIGLGINTRRLEAISERDPSFAVEIIEFYPALILGASPRMREDLGLNSSNEKDGFRNLTSAFFDAKPVGILRNEIALLRFASTFLRAWPAIKGLEVITPSNLNLKLSNTEDFITQVIDLRVTQSRVSPENSLYRPPSWCSVDERWRFQLGYLLRFILCGHQDFTKNVKPISWRENTTIYRAPENHWYQRQYGMFNGHAAFGEDWLPISDWTEKLLSALLHWPGCHTTEMTILARNGFGAVRAQIEARLMELTSKQGSLSKVLMIPLAAPWTLKRSLRACVVQTVIPSPENFKPGDLTFSQKKIRRRHRNHLSAALAAVKRMLALRETHKGLDGRLDLLILPELSVHPRDVKTHLIPFARAHKTIILAGLTYDREPKLNALVNSAVWVIPVQSPSHGLQIQIRKQGKAHLAPEEIRFNSKAKVIQEFRPCQWIIGYEWSGRKRMPPLWLTASICYDATDLRLVADLHRLSDVFAIPALNKDVVTFDQMALALHYHMFQLVIVANNGHYGGSNAYAPYKDSFVRQVFHLHGQPQASMAFLEIENIEEFINRRDGAKSAFFLPESGPVPDRVFKYPPAGN